MIASKVRGLWGPFLCLVAWEVAARLPGADFIVAAPSAIFTYFAQNVGLFSRALATTLTNASIGFVIGNVAAVALAILALTVPRSEPLVRGLALLVFCLPLVAMGPILRVLFGPGPWPQIVLAALAVYYTTLIPLLVGLRSVPSAWLDLVRSYGRGQLVQLSYVRARASLPYLFAGLQIAAPAAFLGAMVGEFTGAERGMGVLTIRAMRAMDIEMTWTLATLATFVAILGFWAVGWIARIWMTETPPTILAAPLIKRRSPWAPLLDPALVALVAIGAWWGFLAISQLSVFFAKGPQHVFDALVLAPDAGQTRETLQRALAETAVFLVPGYVAGLAVGALLAILVVLVPPLAGLTHGLAIALRSVPIITTAPLIVLALGRGAVGTITLVAIMVFFPTFLACLHGLRQAPGQVVDVMRSYAASPLNVLVHARLPAMLPALFAAARMGVPASVLAVTVVEWLATGKGIGSLMALSASLSNYKMLWSAVVLVAVLSVVGYGIVSLLERQVLRIYAPEQLA